MLLRPALLLLRSQLLRWKPRWPMRRRMRDMALDQPHPASHRAELAEITAEEPTAADAWRGGCGWYDSSHDLATGLAVEALEPGPALSPALPAPVWLLLACATQPPAGSAAQA